LLTLVLGLGTIAFSAGLFGGGDIKLIAVAGLWLDLRGGMLLISSILLAGGIVALAYIAARIIRGSPKGSMKSRRVPYGIAIALGTLITISLVREQMPNAQHYTLPAKRP
jgi:prepilin peptidase CpaA